MSKEDQDEIAELLGTKKRAYIPTLALVFESQPIGILLSQLLFWHGKGKRADGYIWKTVDDFKMETGLTATQQRNATNKLREYKVIEYKLAGVPATRHLKLNKEILIFIITRYNEKAELVSPEDVKQFLASGQTITKTTQKKTTNKTSKDDTTDKRSTTAGSAGAPGMSSIGDIFSSYDPNKRKKPKGEDFDDIPF